MKTIVAIFDDISVARQVVEDLVKAGFARHSISLVTNDAQNQYSRFLEIDYVPREEAVTSLEGAGIGIVVGALTGLLFSIITFIIPSLNLFANPIVSAAIGALVGALIGAVVGAVVKITVPEDESPYYAEAIKRGATLISIRTTTPRPAEEVLHRYGTIDLHERISQWRQTGWVGFDTTPKVEEANTEPWQILNVQTVTNTTVSPMPPTVIAEAAAVSMVEPKISDEDTEKSIAKPVQEMEDISLEVNPEPQSLHEDTTEDLIIVPVTESRENPSQE